MWRAVRDWWRFVKEHLLLEIVLVLLVLVLAIWRSKDKQFVSGVKSSTVLLLEAVGIVGGGLLLWELIVAPVRLAREAPKALPKETIRPVLRISGGNDEEFKRLETQRWDGDAAGKIGMQFFHTAVRALRIDNDSEVHARGTQVHVTAMQPDAIPGQLPLALWWHREGWHPDREYKRDIPPISRAYASLSLPWHKIKEEKVEIEVQTWCDDSEMETQRFAVMRVEGSLVEVVPL
jgi:hypothetical protein